ncbi:hypothetical protein D9M71_811300 [compost metagenome]
MKRAVDVKTYLTYWFGFLVGAGFPPAFERQVTHDESSIGAAGLQLSIAANRVSLADLYFAMTLPPRVVVACRAWTSVAMLAHNQ